MLVPYRCKYFKIYELIPPELYNATLEDILWSQFDDRLLKTIDLMRQKYGMTIINNWKTGGQLKNSGLRLPDSEAGVKFSQHKLGRAADLHISSKTPDQIRQDILANPWAEEFKYITCIEDNVNWVHIDVRNHDKIQKGILIVLP